LEQFGLDLKSSEQFLVFLTISIKASKRNVEKNVETAHKMLDLKNKSGYLQEDGQPLRVWTFWLVSVFIDDSGQLVSCFFQLTREALQTRICFSANAEKKTKQNFWTFLNHVESILCFKLASSTNSILFATKNI
jgi:hypothetical protein